MLTENLHKEICQIRQKVQPYTLNIEQMLDIFYSELMVIEKMLLSSHIVDGKHRLTKIVLDEIVRFKDKYQDYNQKLYQAGIDIVNLEMVSLQLDKICQHYLSQEVDSWLSWYLYEIDFDRKGDWSIKVEDREYCINDAASLLQFLDIEVYKH